MFLANNVYSLAGCAASTASIKYLWQNLVAHYLSLLSMIDLISWHNMAHTGEDVR